MRASIRLVGQWALRESCMRPTRHDLVERGPNLVETPLKWPAPRRVLAEVGPHVMAIAAKLDERRPHVIATAAKLDACMFALCCRKGPQPPVNPDHLKMCNTRWQNAPLTCGGCRQQMLERCSPDYSRPDRPSDINCERCSREHFWANSRAPAAKSWPTLAQIGPNLWMAFGDVHSGPRPIRLVHRSLS